MRTHTLALLCSAGLQMHLLQGENEALTRALVEVKVLYAEKDSENMRLAQRLKRSLQHSDARREEAEDLRRHLASLRQEQVWGERTARGSAALCASCPSLLYPPTGLTALWLVPSIIKGPVPLGGMPIQKIAATKYTFPSLKWISLACLRGFAWSTRLDSPHLLRSPAVALPQIHFWLPGGPQSKALLAARGSSEQGTFGCQGIFRARRCGT
jgi:hypothetical protein